MFHRKGFRYPCLQAAAWVVLATVLSAGAGRAQTFLPVPLNLSNTGHAGMPAVAVGPAGDINVAWLDSGSILFRRAADGKSFSSTMTVGASSGASQPQIAANSAGVYVTWASASDIWFSSLANNASSFSAPVNISVGRGIGSGAPTPRIAVDPSGGVDIVWGQNGAWFWHLAKGASAPSVVPVQLTNSAMASQSPRMAINAQGFVYVVWENAGSCPTITLARSTDSAAFSNYAVDDTITVNGVKQTGCASDAQISVVQLASTPKPKYAIHLLWANDSPIQDLIATYAIDDTNSSFTSFQEVVFTNLAGPPAHTPQMAIDANGNINVVWMSDFSMSDSRRVVNFSRSTNGGVNFTDPPIALTNPPASTANVTGFPQLLTEPSGAIDVIWQQASTANPGSAYDIVLARSTDGANFNKRTLSSTPTMQGGTGQIAVDGNGNSYIVWQGSSASASDILFNTDSSALTSPDFSLNVSPNPQTALPGAVLSYSVTVSSVNTFNQSVTLTCANPPAGAQCAFNPATVTASAVGTPSSLTVTLPATIPTGTYAVGVTGTGGGLTHTQSTQLTVGGLTTSITPASATINAGGTGTFTVSLSGTNSFSGNVTFACSGAPSAASCNFSPATVSVPASGTVSTSLSVSVSAKPSTSAVNRAPGGDSGWQPWNAPAAWAITLWGAGLFVLFAVFVSARGARSRFASAGRAVALILLIVTVAGGMLSCGGSTTSSGGGGGGGGNPVTFPMNVQAKSNSATMNLQTISITVP
jgi:hypothetical protein